MSLAILFLQAIVVWILMASAAYFGAMQALDVYFGESRDGTNLDRESDTR